MRGLVLLGLFFLLLAYAAQPGAVPELPTSVPVEAFAGMTPRKYSPAYTKWPEADRAFAAVDLGLKRAWELPDPREHLTELIRVAVEVDPVRACDRVRLVGARLQKLPLPPARRVAWASFACAVSAQDRDLRDALLPLAIRDGRLSLADADLWKPDPLPPGGFPRSDPQVLRDFEKQSLAYRIRLWEAVLLLRSDPAKASELTHALLADARAKGLCSLGCISRSYDYDLLNELAGLDADFYLAVVTKLSNVENVAADCASRAYSRWLNRNRDAFAGTFAKYAVENGTTRGDVILMFAHYDFSKAWAEVAKLPPDDPSSTTFRRSGPLSGLIVMLAWRDPDAALAEAAKEPNEFLRRSLVENVSRVWAQKCPDQIERALKHQDNYVRQSWAREQAAAELKWRQEGNPPRDTPETAPRRWGQEQPQPTATPWLPPDEIQQLLADPSKIAEADRALHEKASHLGQWGPANHALDALGRILSPQLATNAAVWVARNLIRRAEAD